MCVCVITDFLFFFNLLFIYNFLLSLFVFVPINYFLLINLFRRTNYDVCVACERRQCDCLIGFYNTFNDEVDGMHANTQLKSMLCVNENHQPALGRRSAPGAAENMDDCGRFSSWMASSKRLRAPNALMPKSSTNSLSVRPKKTFISTSWATKLPAKIDKTICVSKIVSERSLARGGKCFRLLTDIVLQFQIWQKRMDVGELRQFGTILCRWIHRCCGRIQFKWPQFITMSPLRNAARLQRKRRRFTQSETSPFLSRCTWLAVRYTFNCFETFHTLGTVVGDAWLLWNTNKKKIGNLSLDRIESICNPLLALTESPKAGVGVRHSLSNVKLEWLSLIRRDILPGINVWFSGEKCALRPLVFICMLCGPYNCSIDVALLLKLS